MAIEDDGESDGLYVEAGRTERVESGGRVVMGLALCFFETGAGECGRLWRWCFGLEEGEGLESAVCCCC